MHQGPGYHHMHLRKRVHHKKETWPHPHKGVKFLDDFMYVLAIVVPILTSSQVVKIWVEQEAAGVSLIAWATYFGNSLAWLVYGIVHKEWPIILNNIVCGLINLAVIVGIFVYG